MSVELMQAIEQIKTALVSARDARQTTEQAEALEAVRTAVARLEGGA